MPRGRARPRLPRHTTGASPQHPGQAGTRRGVGLFFGRHTGVPAPHARRGQPCTRAGVARTSDQSPLLCRRTSAVVSIREPTRSPASCASSSSTSTRPASPMGCATVVSGGMKCSASAMSS